MQKYMEVGSVYFCVHSFFCFLTQKWNAENVVSSLIHPPPPHLHTDIQQITGAVWSSLLLQTLHYHFGPQKWLQNCRSHVCGHEVIWKIGPGLPEGHHWTLAGSSSVFLQNKQDCGWCSQNGTALHPATQELCNDLICGHHFGLVEERDWSSLSQTDTALCTHLHLSVDHQLPDRQAAASEAG